jgi:hypothetical protein
LVVNDETVIMTWVEALQGLGSRKRPSYPNSKPKNRAVSFRFNDEICGQVSYFPVILKDHIEIFARVVYCHRQIHSFWWLWKGRAATAGARTKTIVGMNGQMVVDRRFANANLLDVCSISWRCMADQIIGSAVASSTFDVSQA